MLIVDPLTRREVLLAENRSQRPNDFAAKQIQSTDNVSPRSECVFCPGNEGLTPGELHAESDADGDWLVRVVPNKFPAVRLEAEPRGAHEVIIESPGHHRRTGELSAVQLEAVLRTYAARIGYWARDGRFPYQLLFKNVGPSAGASIEHLHSQLIALPKYPPHVEAEQQALVDHRLVSGNCGWCDRVQSVMADLDRVVLDTADFIAFCPAASRQPFETWILPKDHTESFSEAMQSSGSLSQLANILLPVLREIEAEIAPAGYNLMIHTGGGRHWRIEILPRVASLAGFELATGHYLNVLSPQQAALMLREKIGKLRISHPV